MMMYGPRNETASAMPAAISSDGADFYLPTASPTTCDQSRFVNRPRSEGVVSFG